MRVGSNIEAEERLAWIRERLRVDGRVHIGEAASTLGVSDMTVRRDLDELAATGAARRVRGGAVAVAPLSFSDRHAHRAQAKARIAAKLIGLVPTSGAIAIDGSSTMMRLAATMSGARGLSVLTHGIETFQALHGKPGITPLLTGGQLDSRTGSLVGSLAMRGAEALLFERVFVSAAGVDPWVGPSETCIEEADVKRVLIDRAQDVVLGVDASKLGTRAVAAGVEWSRVSVMVTELDVGDRRLDPYRDLVDLT